MAIIADIVTQQKNFFKQGITKEIAWRKHQLLRLQHALKTRERDILSALAKDLAKPLFEAYISEVYLCLQEIQYALKNLETWAKPVRAHASLTLAPSTNYITYEPYGIVAIIAPWNYPVQLTFIPLIGAIAAGNCAIVKPSEHAHHSAGIIQDIIQTTFDEQYVAVCMGDASIAQELLQQPIDYIFFTGGTAIGKIVMKTAAEQLIPLTLELGGKSPCIVHYDANLTSAARTITWGKFLNAGQNCVAPDYVLVHKDCKQKLIAELKQAITKFYGTDPEQSPNYGRIINERHVERLAALLDATSIVFGGTMNRTTRYIAPTLVDGIDWQHPIMQEEIFGPILPILSYDVFDEVIALMSHRPKPLAMYLFSHDGIIQHKLTTSTSSGSVVFNDVVVQAASVYLPFGGVGTSGFGRYHGKASFTTFSNIKTIVYGSSWLGNFWRYPPYRWLHRLLKKIINLSHK